MCGRDIHGCELSDCFLLVDFSFIFSLLLFLSLAIAS